MNKNRNTKMRRVLNTKKNGTEDETQIPEPKTGPCELYRVKRNKHFKRKEWELINLLTLKAQFAPLKMKRVLMFYIKALFFTS